MRMLSPALSLLTMLPLSLVGCLDFNYERVVDEALLELDAAGIERLHLSQGVGDVEIVGDEAATGIEMRITLLGPKSTKQDADARRDVIMNLEDDNGVARATAFFQDFGLRYTMRVTLTVPASLAVDVIDETGDLSVINVADLTVDDSTGDIWLEQISGAVTVIDGTGDVEMTDIFGDVLIEDSTGDIDVNDVDGDVGIEDDTGDVEVHGVDGDVDIVDGTGDIRASRVSGTVTISDTTGDIDLQECGDVDIQEDSTGDVRIQ
ncbi:MAG: DUF4097 family beta strand repeat-containing protein [Myxococcota bacterium]